MTEQKTKISVRANTSLEINLHFCGPIEGPENYVEENQALREAAPGDVAHFRLNTPGGRMDSLAQLLVSIDETNAMTIGHMEGICHSAGTLLFLKCEDWVVGDHVTMLIHNFSGGAFGKGIEVENQAIAQRIWCHGLMRDVYTGFLTEGEIDELLNKNQDIWLTSDEIVERLEGLQKFRDSVKLTNEIAIRKDLIGQLSEADKAAK